MSPLIISFLRESNLKIEPENDLRPEGKHAFASIFYKCANESEDVRYHEEKVGEDEMSLRD